MKKLIEVVFAVGCVPVVIWKRLTCKHPLWLYQPQGDDRVLTRCFRCGYTFFISYDEFAKIVVGK